MDGFGALAAARRNAGFSQKSLAVAVGVDESSVAKWERGLRRPNAARLTKLNQVLGVTLTVPGAAKAAKKAVKATKKAAKVARPAARKVAAKKAKKAPATVTPAKRRGRPRKVAPVVAVPPTVRRGPGSRIRPTVLVVVGTDAKPMVAQTGDVDVVQLNLTTSAGTRGASAQISDLPRDLRVVAIEALIAARA